MCPRNRQGGGLCDVWQGDLDYPLVVQAFQVLDRDGDGAIRSEDLTAFFGGCCLGHSVSAQEASSMISQADLDGDGAVGLEEFQQLVAGGGASLIQKQREEEQAALRAVFDVLDVNKDGKLGREDLRSAMAISGNPVSEEEVDAMVGAAAELQASCHSSATITFDTFAKLMSSF